MFILTVVVAYFIAWAYREEYDPMKYVRAYAIYVLPYLILSLFLHIKVILIIGIYLFGIIVLVFRNQHYFDK